MGYECPNIYKELNFDEVIWRFPIHLRGIYLSFYFIWIYFSLLLTGNKLE